MPRINKAPYFQALANKDKAQEAEANKLLRACGAIKNRNQHMQPNECYTDRALTKDHETHLFSYDNPDFDYMNPALKVSKIHNTYLTDALQDRDTFYKIAKSAKLYRLELLLAWYTILGYTIIEIQTALLKANCKYHDLTKLDNIKNIAWRKIEKCDEYQNIVAIQEAFE